MNRPVIQCTGLTKCYGSVRVLNGLDLNLESGEILCLFGPNGCGKTTTLRCIAGFERPDAGEIYIAGTITTSRTYFKPPEHREIGMVFQEQVLFPHLTVAQNIKFGLKNMSRRDRDSRLDQIVELVGLRGLEKRYPHELSGGEQQRVAVARTLAPRPQALLLDEPFGNIDATSRTALRIQIRSILKETKTSTIFVTHDRDEAFTLADRLAIMKEGEIIQITSPEEAYTHPNDAYVASLLGPCSFMPGILKGNAVETEIGLLTCSRDAVTGNEDTPVDVLVRPEDLDFKPDIEGIAVVLSRDYRGEGSIYRLALPSGGTVECFVAGFTTIASGSRASISLRKTTPFWVFKRTGA